MATFFIFAGNTSNAASK